MEKVIILRYGEIHLKGANRGYFENALVQNIKKSLSGFSYNLNKISGRYEIAQYKENEEKILVDKLCKVFGLFSLSLATKIKTDSDNILQFCSELTLNQKTFKVVVRRADKRFPIKSMEFASLCGDKVLRNNANIKVDVRTPEVEVKIDIREEGNTYISFEDIKCAGGMPVGTAGKGVLLLSGGIDSPVAGYFLAHRGMRIHAVHFHSFPYTSLQAKDKVVRLAKKISEYCGDINLHILSLKETQESIYKNCDRDYMIILMRRIMMRVAEKLCEKINAQAIITGENLAQVASQTMESITVTNAVVQVPVFRPLIGFDKADIIEKAKKINTYDISIEPYEDCCTVFLPKNPVTRPNMKKVLEQESKLDIDKLVQECLDGEEHIFISANEE